MGLVLLCIYAEKVAFLLLFRYKKTCFVRFPENILESSRCLLSCSRDLRERAPQDPFRGCFIVTTFTV